MEYTKHECIPCGRCGEKVECKANNFTQCQCSQIQLTLNELQYIAEEGYEDCMCLSCLQKLKLEYQNSLANNK
jgi:hypothetical protein